MVWDEILPPAEADVPGRARRKAPDLVPDSEAALSPGTAPAQARVIAAEPLEGAPDVTPRALPRAEQKTPRAPVPSAMAEGTP